MGVEKHEHLFGESAGPASFCCCRTSFHCPRWTSGLLSTLAITSVVAARIAVTRNPVHQLPQSAGHLADSMTGVCVDAGALGHVASGRRRPELETPLRRLADLPTSRPADQPLRRLGKVSRRSAALYLILTLPHNCHVRRLL